MIVFGMRYSLTHPSYEDYFNLAFDCKKIRIGARIISLNPTNSESVATNGDV